MVQFSSNPQITSFLRRFTFIEMMVLVVVGFGLFLFPSIIRPHWAWEIAPFNAGFLGAIYLGAMVPVALMYSTGRWSPTRVILKAITTFTGIILGVSLYNLQQFDFGNPAVWVWFVLYVSLPASGAYHMWLYRDMSAQHLLETTPNWRRLLRFVGQVLAIYGVGLIVAPEFFSAVFPWKLDTFHSELYSATFITGSVMMYGVSTKTTRMEFVAVGLTEAVFAICAIASLVMVDAKLGKIDWAAPVTTIWVGLLGILAVLGVAMVLAGRRLPD